MAGGSSQVPTLSTKIQNSLPFRGAAAAAAAVAAAAAAPIPGFEWVRLAATGVPDAEGHSQPYGRVHASVVVVPPHPTAAAKDGDKGHSIMYHSLRRRVDPPVHVSRRCVASERARCWCIAKEGSI